VPEKRSGVRLEESRESLEEVTVVAYGEQRRGQVSGSVATVDAARLQNKPASNVLTLAKGQMAGCISRASRAIRAATM
jgi:hypothetical protein